MDRGLGLDNGKDLWREALDAGKVPKVGYDIASLGSSQQEKSYHVWVVWVKATLRTPPTSAVSFQPFPGFSCVCCPTSHQVQLPQADNGAGEGVSKERAGIWMGFSPTFSVMPFVSAELINVLLAKLIPHSPFSSCGVWDGWFMDCW